MIQEPITFRLPRIYSIFPFIGVFFFGFMGYLTSTINGGFCVLLFFLVFCMLCLAVIPEAFYKVTVTDETITCWRYFRVCQLRWTDIYECIPRWQDSFSLSSHDGFEKIYINSQLTQYLSLVDIIKSKRPDLFRVPGHTIAETRTFTMKPATYLLLAFFLLLGIALMGGSFLAPADPEIQSQTHDFLTRAGLFLIGLLTVVVFLSGQKKMEIKDSHLEITHFGGWKKKIYPQDIVQIFTDQINFQHTKVYTIKLELQTGKEISLSGFAQGMPTLNMALKEWLENHHNH